MPSLPTLHIAEHQSFTQSDIESRLKTHYIDKHKAQDSNNPSKIPNEILEHIESKAQKIFADLQEFAEKNNDLLQCGKKALRAKNHVGLIQTKSGFCMEVLPKTFDKNGFADFTESQCNFCNDKSTKFNKQEFANNQVKPFIDHITKRSKQPDNKSNLCKSCQIHRAKQILLNCLVTLKDSPFKQSHIASLQSLNLPLLEVFIQMFLAELERLIHRGLKSDYEQIAQNRAFLKGKLLFNEQIKHNLIHKERFFTQSDEYSLNSAPNRLIKRTLELLRTLSLSPKTRTKLDSLYFIFEEITPSSHIERDFAKCKNMRRFKEYELVLLWCAIFLRQRSFSAYSGSERAFALLFPMERLFESFVGYWCKRVACDYEVKTQERIYYLMRDSQEDIFQLKSDMVMRGEENGEIIILDTKWKIPDSTNDEKRHGIAQADLYQMWAYASKYAKKKPSSESKVSVWLVYPLCEKTKDLQTKWAESSKKWYFKASQDSENSENHISIALSFFPLYEQNP